MRLKRNYGRGNAWLETTAYSHCLYIDVYVCASFYLGIFNFSVVSKFNVLVFRLADRLDTFDNYDTLLLFPYDARYSKKNGRLVVLAKISRLISTFQE